MRIAALVEQTMRSAAAGGAAMLSPQELTPRGGPTTAEPRFRPAPNPFDGTLRQDPDFSLPTTAGPLTWRLFYDSGSAATVSEWGYGRRASFPLYLVQNSPTVTVDHEDGSMRDYVETSPGSGIFNPVGVLNGDTLLYDPVNGWTETLGENGFAYHFPVGSTASVAYRATPQGQRLTYNYAAGLLQSVVEPAGRRVTLAYNGDGHVGTIEDWGQRGLVVLTYVGGQLTDVWEQEGVATHFQYDLNNNLTEIVDPAGYATTYTYDSIGRVYSRSVAGNLEQYTYTFDIFRRSVYTDPLGRTWTYTSDTGGYPKGKTDPLGNQSTYVYANGQPQSFADQLGQTKTFSYDSNGYWIATQDELGYITTFQRDQYGNITTVIDALNSYTTMTYGPNPALKQLEQIVDPLGRRQTFGYDSTGLTSFVWDEAGYRTTFVWSNLGVLASVLNARGFVWTFTYDAMGNQIETLDPLGYRWSYVYDLRARMVGAQTPLGHRWTTVFDPRDLVQALVDPLGFRATNLWNAEASVTEVIDQSGNHWTNLYDAANQQTAAIDPLSQRTSFAYDQSGRLIVTQDPLGANTTLVYDAAGRRVASVDPLGYRTSLAFDAAGRLVTHLDARGYQTSYSYDATGRIVSVCNALGYIFTVDYDAAGQPTVAHDSLGNLLTLQFETRGLVQAVIDQLGKRTTFAYTATGRQQSITDPRGQCWTAIYDAWDRPQARINPLGFRWTLIYDPVGRVSALWDARGNRWSQLHDARDRSVGTTDPLGRMTTYSYDPVGQLVTVIDQKGQLATYAYSPRNELTGEIFGDGTRMTYSYDAAGRTRTVVDATGWHTLLYNARGDLVGVQAPEHPRGGILTNAYDAVGNRTLIQSWLGSQSMLYDALSRCSQMADPDGHATTWLYDSLNRPTMQLNWNGTRTTWSYDARGRLSSVRHSTAAGALLDSAAYTYDDAGNPLSRVTNSTRATWTYDTAGQLATDQHSATGLTDTFTYDGAGNRIQRSRTQSGALTVSTYAYDAAGQLVTMLAGTALTTFLFDGNGNLQSENTVPSGVTTYLWDALDRLTGVILPGGTRTTYAYRYDDLRASQNTGSGVQTAVWDVPGPSGFGDLFEELDSSGSLLRAYYRAVDLTTQKDASGSYVLHWIDIGTAQLMSDASQASAASYQFTGWGELLSLVGGASTPLSWNGRWGYYRDTSARTWVRARHFDVLRGRWLSADPAGIRGGLNPYAYANNSPLLLPDPSGMAPANPGFPPVAAIHEIMVDLLPLGTSGSKLAHIQRMTTGCPAARGQSLPSGTGVPVAPPMGRAHPALRPGVALSRQTENELVDRIKNELDLTDAEGQRLHREITKKHYPEEEVWRMAEDILGDRNSIRQGNRRPDRTPGRGSGHYFVWTPPTPQAIATGALLTVAAAAGIVVIVVLAPEAAAAAGVGAAVLWLGHRGETD